MGGEAVEAACADDRSDQGMDVGAPGRAEAVGDFAEDDAGSECPLGRVVGRRHVTVGHEGEELGAPAFGLLLQFGPGCGRRRHRQQTVEAAVRRGAVLGQGAVLQGLPPPADGDRPAQQAAQGRREARLAGINRILDVAQDVGPSKPDEFRRVPAERPSDPISSSAAGAPPAHQ